MPGADRDEVIGALSMVTSHIAGGGEARPQQVAMAVAVAEAIHHRRHLVVQAGTGTGKSLAYLLPALLLGVKTVVATATKALQDQLAGKDLPLLAAHLGIPVDFAVLKGRSNYLCIQKARETAGTADGSLELAPGDGLGQVAREIRRVLQWAASSPTGDRAELDFEPSPHVWAQLSTSAVDCPGAQRCPSGEVCFAEEARRKAEEAAIVVVNTHLYGAHLASGGHVLPDHDVVIFDEAHELEDIAAASLGLELTAGRLRALAAMARTLVADRQATDAVSDAAELLESALMPGYGTSLDRPLDEPVDTALSVAAERVSRLVNATRQVSSDDPRRARVLQAGGHLGSDLALLRSPAPTDVTWVEGSAHAPVLRMAPVDVAEPLRERLWGTVTGVLTSATIPPQLPARLGVLDCDEIDVGSPFDYHSQGLLYCAAHLPDPRQPSYVPAMHAELIWLIASAGGRTLALFTSWRAMQAAALAVRDRVPYRILTQADLPKPALVDAFAAEESSCLFATMGFWQGVDVPGAALSLVVIDRIPFPRPDEPLQQARRDRAGPGAFRTVDLPRAATLLAQGVGRLIRSETDTGVVAILDPRLASATYRWDLVRALPPMRRTRERDEVRAFLATLHAAPATLPRAQAAGAALTA
ncbi:MAG: ATP-dependent DNA helicase [Acidimicrobiales bacterium]